jgi:hypothetical protein
VRGFVPTNSVFGAVFAFFEGVAFHWDDFLIVYSFGLKRHVSCSPVS